LIAVGSLWGDKLGPAIQPLRGNIRQLACQPSANVRCRAAVDGHFKNQTTLTPLVLTPLVPFVPARRCSGLLSLALVTLDTVGAGGIRVEPPPIALGSGQAASGGHCSGR